MSLHINLSLSKLLKRHLLKRSRYAHKGDFGHVLLIGGNYGVGGAILIAANAAARTGAGLVSILTRPEHVIASNCMRPEIMCHSADDESNTLLLLEKCTMIVIGPGLGQDSWGKKLFEQVLNFIQTHPKPILIDADGLNLLAENPQYNNNWILTPHPGEAARLLKKTSDIIQKDRQTAVLSLQKKYGGICILKGAGTLICHEENGKQKISICKAGNPGMASGGMGDLLSGIIGGLSAQKLTLEAAAQLGVILHAKAGDLAVKKYGERGLLALDLLDYLRMLINK